MYKRALMLTAATVALLAGPAYAAGPTTITDKQTTNQKTSTTGDLTIDTTGSVVVTSTTPAITVDSNNFVTINSSGLVSNKDKASAVGIELDAGFTGGLTSSGTIDLSGTGSLKTGITLLGTGDFTGDINLQSGSVLRVTGDNGYGIYSVQTANLVGDLTLAGTISLGSTTTTTAITSPTAIRLLGNVTGDILNSGTISATGTNAQGFIMTGLLTGSFTNSGTLQTLGTTSIASSNNPEAGTALAFGANVTGGILNDGPTSTVDATARGTIRVAGAGQAVLISQAAGGLSSSASITIGQYGATGYSFLNRGTITATPIDPNYNVSTIVFAGATSSANIVFTDGFFNSGGIAAAVSSDPHGPLAYNATALWLQGFVDLPEIVNSTQTGAGTITASFAGTNSVGGTATAIRIDQSSNLPSITNQGTISAVATTTDSTAATLQAWAIRDQSGTLNYINNTGVISAIISGNEDTSSAIFARAVDLSNTTSDVTFQNTGIVLGDVIFGIGNDTFTVSGSSSSSRASVVGNITFGGTTGGGTDSLTIGNFGTVRGTILETAGTNLDINVNQGGTLAILNTTDTLFAHDMVIANGASLGLTLAQAFNGTSKPLIQANSINMELASADFLNIGFGGFIGAGASDSSFILFDTVMGNLTITNPANVQTAIESAVPFLFDGQICGNNIAFFASCGSVTTRSQLVLDLTPKSKDEVFVQTVGGTVKTDLFGYKLYDFVNNALATDDELGAAVISAGLPVSGVSLTQAQGFDLYKNIYGAFAPDVTGASRAIVVSLTDQASGPVGARQRALRMYANQAGSATLWGQEFAQRLNGSDSPGGMYHNTGFGFALGLDSGDPRNGRYGGALTFYSGDSTEKAPRQSKTNSEYYMLSLYSNWRGKGLFFDTQANLGYGTLTGTRKIDAGTVVRTADSTRNSLFITGGFTTGAVLASGGTSIIPLLSIDGMTMREDGYTETNGGTGVDLRVNPVYANSARAYVGTSVRQDLNFGDFFLQPEARIGYRYDFLADPVDIKASFASVTPVSQFTLTGPDPGKGNVVAGGSLAVTTDAWSIGLNYDYIRSSAGSISQSGTITLVGRI